MGIESPAETIVSAGLFKRKILKEKKQREKICWYRYQDADSAAFICILKPADSPRVTKSLSDE